MSGVSEGSRSPERRPGAQDNQVGATIRDGLAEWDALKHRPVHQPPAPEPFNSMSPSCFGHLQKFIKTLRPSYRTSGVGPDQHVLLGCEESPRTHPSRLEYCFKLYNVNRAVHRQRASILKISRGKQSANAAVNVRNKSGAHNKAIPVWGRARMRRLVVVGTGCHRCFMGLPAMTGMLAEAFRHVARSSWCTNFSRITGCSESRQLATT